MTVSATTDTLSPDAQTRAWWDQVQPLCEQFFDLSSRFHPEHTTTHLIDLLMEMGLIFENLRAHACPVHMIELRADLVSAMSGTMTSLAELLADKNAMAMDHLNHALIHLQHFHIALDEMDLHYQH